MPENRWYREEDDHSRFQNGLVPVVQISEKELTEWYKEWKLTLIINVLGKKVNFRVLENKINRDWARSGPVDIIDMPRRFYTVRFTNEDDYKHVLLEGPWMVAEHYILIQRWRPNFLKSARSQSRVAVWVRIPELPLEFYHDRFFAKVGAILGVLLKVDRLTSIHSRGQFARVCVEVDLSKPLIPQVEVLGEVINLEYEGLHSVCFSCGIFGHHAADCKNAAAEKGGTDSAGSGGHHKEAGKDATSEKDRADVSENPSEQAEDQEGNRVIVGESEATKSSDEFEGEGPHINYGSWMLSKKDRKRRSNTPKFNRVNGSESTKGYQAGYENQKE